MWHILCEFNFWHSHHYSTSVDVSTHVKTWEAVQRPPGSSPGLSGTGTVAFPCHPCRLHWCCKCFQVDTSDGPRSSRRDSVSKPGKDEFWQIYEDLWIVDPFLWQVQKRTESIFCKPRCCSQSLSHIRLFAIPCTVAHQAPLSMGLSRQVVISIPCTVAHQVPLSMGLSRQEYWSRLPFLPPGDLMADIQCKSCLWGDGSCYWWLWPWGLGHYLALSKSSVNICWMSECYIESSCFISSVAQSCPTLCDPVNCSTPGLPVHHQLPEFTQTHVCWVSDAIQPSHPLSSPSPPTSNRSQHQGLFKWVSYSHQVTKVLEFQIQHQSFQWIFRTDFL